MGRFISEDSYEGQITNPLSLNLYSYTLNNPLGYTDPTGHWADTLLDGVALTFDMEMIRRNPKSFENWAALVADGVCTALPLATGGGALVRNADNIMIAAKNNVQKGVQWVKNLFKGTKHLTPWGSKTAVRIDTIDDIAKFGKSLGKDNQLFLTSKEAISGLDLTDPMDLAKAEEILGLPSGRLTNSSGIVLTEINITNLEYSLPTSGNELFIPGGMTSGGAPEIVINPINVFSDPSVESLQFFFRK